MIKSANTVTGNTTLTCSGNEIEVLKICLWDRHLMYLRLFQARLEHVQSAMWKEYAEKVQQMRNMMTTLDMHRPCDDVHLDKLIKRVLK